LLAKNHADFIQVTIKLELKKELFVRKLVQYGEIDLKVLRNNVDKLFIF